MSTLKKRPSPRARSFRSRLPSRRVQGPPDAPVRRRGEPPLGEARAGRSERPESSGPAPLHRAHRGRLRDLRERYTEAGLRTRARRGVDRVSPGGVRRLRLRHREVRRLGGRALGRSPRHGGRRHGESRARLGVVSTPAARRSSSTLCALSRPKPSASSSRESRRSQLLSP